jgi:RimJ/RimL family protein N-acetyltransferase
MKNWIQHPLKLIGETVELISLERKHLPVLEVLAKDKRIWEFYVLDGSDSNKFQAFYETALLDRKKGTQFPFAIFHKQHQKIIGSTRFLDIQPKHKKLEIGATWLHPDYWATGVNLECKLLLLTFCFETLHTYRVQLKTDENNIRSRKAIAKIGGQFEGIFRYDIIRDNGTRRSSAYFSLLDDEWADKKAKLIRLCKEGSVRKD